METTPEELLDSFIAVEHEKLQVYKSIVYEEYNQEYDSKSINLKYLLDCEKELNDLLDTLRNMMRINKDTTGKMLEILNERKDSNSNEDIISGILFQDEFEIVYQKISNLIVTVDWKFNEITPQSPEDISPNSNFGIKIQCDMIEDLFRILLEFIENNIKEAKDNDARYYLIQAKYEIIFIYNNLESEMLSKYKLEKSNQNFEGLSFSPLDDVFLLFDSYYKENYEEVKSEICSDEIKEQFKAVNEYNKTIYEDGERVEIPTKKELITILIRTLYIASCLYFVDEKSFNDYRKDIANQIDGIMFCEDEETGEEIEKQITPHPVIVDMFKDILEIHKKNKSKIHVLKYIL